LSEKAGGNGTSGKGAAAAAARRGKKKGSGGWGREKADKEIVGGLNTAVKSTTSTTGQGASTTGEPKRGELSFAGFWPTGATGLRPVPPAGSGTTGARRRYHRQDREQRRSELSVANLEPNQTWLDFIKSLQNNGHA